MKEPKPVIFSSSHGDHEILYSNGSVHSNGLNVNWGVKNIGFGSFFLGYDNESGKIVISSELMSKEFVSKVMEKLIQEAIFSDFEESQKSIVPISLSEANSLINFKPQILYCPFFIEDDPDDNNLLQRRWNVKDNKVLNIWFDKKKIQLKNEDPLDLDLYFSEQQSFAFGFVKAELWSFNMIEVIR